MRGLFLVQIDYGLRMQVYFFARKEAVEIRKLKRYSTTRFKSADSVYDKAAADYAVAFIQALKHTKGTWAGQSFELIDWQERIIRDVFGVLKPNGYRQFNTAYVEIPKKNGKSELAAAIALLLTCGDGEERAEVYGCAADRQQAAIVFDVAKDMVTMCPALAKRVKIMATQKRLVYVPTGSYYQVLSADVANKHGFNTHGVIFDELHTQPNRKLFDVMTKGSGDARMQPLYFLITTAGDNQNSICWEVHQKALDIIDGRKRDPTFYPVIYGAAQEDDWTDPKAIKADLSIELAEAVLYADDGAAEVIKDFKSGTLSLGVDDIGVSAAQDLTGAVTDDNGVLISASENAGAPVAVGFRAMKPDGKYRYFWLYKVKFGIPATNLQTKGDSITFSTPTMLSALSVPTKRRMS